MKNKKGFALLYAIIIISVVSVIAFGLASISLKQKVLSSLAIDSQVAFYAADAGMECALFYNLKVFNPMGAGNNNIGCFDPDPGHFGQLLTFSTIMNPPSAPFIWFATPRKEPCFSIELISPGIPPANPRPSISVKGYSTCQSNTTRYVERNLRAFF